MYRTSKIAASPLVLPIIAVKKKFKMLLMMRLIPYSVLRIRPENEKGALNIIYNMKWLRTKKANPLIGNTYKQVCLIYNKNDIATPLAKCCAVMCCAVMCCAVMCCAVLCCAVLNQNLVREAKIRFLE
nr:hypothetical protein [uncultured Capnocytophaga sp.]